MISFINALIDEISWKEIIVGNGSGATFSLNYQSKYCIDIRKVNNHLKMNVMHYNKIMFIITHLNVPAKWSLPNCDSDFRISTKGSRFLNRCNQKVNNDVQLFFSQQEIFFSARFSFIHQV